MQKILIIGASGSGKSTLAKELGRLLQLPVYHLDTYYWKPGWQPSDQPEFDALLQDLLSQPEWIIDGNYMRTLSWRVTQSNLVIYLDYPRRIYLYRAFKRKFQYRNKTRSDMALGCPEKIDATFIKWLWNFEKETAPEIEHLLNKSGVPVIRLQSPLATAQFLQRIKQEGTTALK